MGAGEVILINLVLGYAPENEKWGLVQAKRRRACTPKAYGERFLIFHTSRMRQ